MKLSGKIYIYYSSNNKLKKHKATEKILQPQKIYIKTNSTAYEFCSLQLLKGNKKDKISYFKEFIRN